MYLIHDTVLQDGKMMFSLEANNLVDENGNSKQTQMPYFENGEYLTAMHVFYLGFLLYAQKNAFNVLDP